MYATLMQLYDASARVLTIDPLPVNAPKQCMVRSV